MVYNTHYMIWDILLKMIKNLLFIYIKTVFINFLNIFLFLNGLIKIPKYFLIFQINYSKF